MMNNPRVAISQPYFILGGRLSLVLEIVKSLNNLGIEPDILALGYAFTPDQIYKKYGHDLRMHFRTVAKGTPWHRLPQDFQILIFNYLLRKFSSSYDLIINSSDSQIHLPEEPRIISYVHFPREYLVKRGLTESYFLNSGKFMVFLARISDRLLRWFYSRSREPLKQSVVCNSMYSRSCFLEAFPEYPKEIPVIYPPIKLVEYQVETEEERRGVISLGRFSRLKMQFEQIKVAEKLPDIDFHLVGFVTERAYFERCKSYVESKGLKNVHLHPNLDYSEMIRLLNSSKYFLHNMVNEPFGITAVEAIAAGSIPIVHNSGGQKETVPDRALRYDELSDIPAILNNLEAKSPLEIQTLIKMLQSNALENFDEPIFLENMTRFLQDILANI